MNTLNTINEGSSILKDKNVKTYKIDSEILLADVLKKERSILLANLDKKLNFDQINQFRSLILRRSLCEPIAYILKKKEFWSKNFFVKKDVLIPRPETEIMVEKVIKIFKNKKIFILDIGTGSGCILISLLSELIKAKGLGVDICPKALEAAKINAIEHNINKRVKFLAKPFTNIFNNKFDLIVSNPPYIRSCDIKNLDKDVKNFEPKIALDGGKDGLDVIRKVIYKSKELLKVNGLLALEIGYGQYRKVSKILVKNSFKIENKLEDHNRNVRCLISRYKRA